MPEARPFYNRFAWAYDLIIDAPVVPRCNFIERICRKSNINFPFTALDAGCGTGNYSIELASRGHNITGVDSSRYILEEAREKSGTFVTLLELVQVDMLSLPFINQFDLILCRGVLNDLIDDRSRCDVFSQFRRALKDKGLIIFDVRDWEGSVRQKSATPVTTKEIQTERGSLKFTSRTKLDEESHSLNIHEKHSLEGPNGGESHEWNLSMRCWTVTEVADALRSAGLLLVEQYGGFDESLAVGTTERIVSVARPTCI